jgi:hypothetical protein
VPQFCASASGVVATCTTPTIDVARNVETKFLLLDTFCLEDKELLLMLLFEVFLCLVMWAWSSVVAWVKLDMVFFVWIFLVYEDLVMVWYDFEWCIWTMEIFGQVFIG